jgi:hypothetical protein
MAVRYAVATGNWSNTATWDGGTLPTSADDVYSNGFTVTIDQDVTVLTLRNTAQSPAVAGGGFVLNDGFIVNPTGGLIQGTGTVITVPVTTGNSCTINCGTSNIVRANNTTNAVIVLSGSGTLNVNGNIIAATTGNAGLLVTGVNSILNFIGNIFGGSAGSAHGISTDVNCTMNIVGNSKGGLLSNNCIGVRANSTAVISFVGDLTGGEYSNNQGLQILNGTIDFTGNLFGGNLFGVNSAGLNITGNATAMVTGNIYGQIAPGFLSTSNCFVEHFGSIITNDFTSGGNLGNFAYNSTGGNAINILTGPFISSQYGANPLCVRRMHYKQTSGSYYELRNSSNNGALPPSLAAPLVRLFDPLQPNAVPSPADVRDGLNYALNTSTGTLKVPPPNTVSIGVPVDNTTGTALLTGDSWIAAISSSNDPFAERLRNVATVQTTAAQIAAF